MEVLAMSDDNFQTLIQVVGVILLAYMTLRQKLADLAMAQLKKDVEVVHKSTNSIVQKLVDQAGATGRAQGKSEERERADDANTRLPNNSEGNPLIVELATTDVRTGEQLADKDDMIAAVKEAAEAVKEAAQDVAQDVAKEDKPRDAKKKT